AGSEGAWRRLGFDAMSQEAATAACERIFAKHLGGHSLATNARPAAPKLAGASASGGGRGSAWLNFHRVQCEKWSHENLVLMGDAAATAHFSVGSGTNVAVGGAIALAGDA